MSPEFPIRVITGDGESCEIETPDDLLAAFDAIDSTDPATHTWIRDAQDRTVRARVRNGVVEVLELERP
jgi:hypothetical protein